MPPTIEHFTLCSTAYVPNSKYPVLVYWDVLPKPQAEGRISAFLETNGWEERGFWPDTPVYHIHPNTHECYNVVRGSATTLLGYRQFSPLIDLVSGCEYR